MQLKVWTVYDPTFPPLYPTKISKSLLAYRRLFGSPFFLAMLERLRPEQKRRVGRVTVVSAVPCEASGAPRHEQFGWAAKKS